MNNIILKNIREIYNFIYVHLDIYTNLGEFVS